MHHAKPIDLTDMPTDDRAAFVARLAMLVRTSAFRRRSAWPRALVILTDGDKRVTSRVDFAHWARANDLAAVSRECLSSTLPPGNVLVWIAADNAIGACAGLALVHLDAEIERLRAVHANA